MPGNHFWTATTANYSSGKGNSRKGISAAQGQVLFEFIFCPNKTCSKMEFMGILTHPS